MLRPRRLPLACAILAVALACGDGSRAPTAPTTPGTTPTTPGPGATCSGPATYNVTFRATWDASSHGSSPPFPAGAHFSRVVGATHAEPVSLWRRGGIATQGIENMAETGSVGVLCQEVQAEAGRGRAGDCIQGREASFPSPGTVRLRFDAAEDRPFVTLVSMIAPSPDWFVGVDSLALRQGGCWRQRIEQPLVGYDAGTDSGATFTAPDADVTPHQPIGLIEALPGAVRETPFATLVLARSDGS